MDMNVTMVSCISWICVLVVCVRCYSARSGLNECGAVPAARVQGSGLHCGYRPLSSVLILQRIQRSVARQGDILPSVVGQLLSIGRRPTAAAERRLPLRSRQSVWSTGPVRTTDSRRRAWLVDSPAVLHRPPRHAVRVYSHRRVHCTSATHRQLESPRDEGQGQSRDPACWMQSARETHSEK